MLNLDFLDNSLPVEAGNAEIASNEIAKFQKYCESLGKKPRQLTEEELNKFYNLDKNNML